ncbi:SDR family oxidoreductase [Myxococcota bacterium]|nr:SDR family oxidoreductase [Myxococcota bacterium]MCZ7617764.1 SDR family oxidoreductase [Myxococcota bacterium]
MTAIESFRDLRVLVTGASSGIGRALSLRLAREGARVALVARRREELEALAAEIAAAGGEAVALPADVADRRQVEVCVEKARAALGGIDLLVNNAGYGHHRPFLDWDTEDMEQLLHVNYFGALYFTKALLPDMVARRRGWIVFVSSVAGRIAPPDESAYAASKFALTGLASSLSHEVEPHGVHVLTVFPGVIRTPFFDAEALAAMPPVARRGMVEVDGLVTAILRALERGRRELTHPRWMAAGYWAQTLAPRFLRRQLQRVTRRSREPSGS